MTTPDADGRWTVTMRWSITSTHSESRVDAPVFVYTLPVDRSR